MVLCFLHPSLSSLGLVLQSLISFLFRNPTARTDPSLKSFNLVGKFSDFPAKADTAPAMVEQEPAFLEEEEAEEKIQEPEKKQASPVLLTVVAQE
ncbi:hypothetical protein V6N13_082902 [Hibiscus sabdariffa]|uniref:Uncharacterized protein n=1 Tax=Hibiscus sabdariffa TaxID=183260 RepID=A0ABR2BZK8_9ROSI